VKSEQRPRRDREISLAGAATLASRAVRAAAIVGVQTAALRADRGAVRLSPAHIAESRLGLIFGHANDLGQRERLGGGGKEEVLSQDRYLSFPIAKEYVRFDGSSRTFYRFRELS
jgi:hypothetical protein